MSFQKFVGNCPGNVRKAAKYTVKISGLIAIVYDTDDGKRWHPATEEHPELAYMVNAAKVAHSYSGTLGGSFYINEYHHVVVPVGKKDVAYYLAGTYSKPLRFDFDGKAISGEPVDLDGNSMSPGGVWQGPHAGIRYGLVVNGNNIFYENTVLSAERVRGIDRILLSDYIDREKVNITASLVRKYKKYTGGRFYVNEFGCLFSRIEKQSGWEYIYLGKLDMDNWFPNPHPADGGDDDA